MKEKRFYTNGNELISGDHRKIREIVSKEKFTVDDFGPKLKGSPKLSRKVIDIKVIDGFRLEFTEPSGMNLVGMNLVDAALPSINYERL